MAGEVVCVSDHAKDRLLQLPKFQYLFDKAKLVGVSARRVAKEKIKLAYKAGILFGGQLGNIHFLKLYTDIANDKGEFVIVCKRSDDNRVDVTTVLTKEMALANLSVAHKSVWK